MMLKSIKKIIILFSICIGFSSCDENNYVEYKPHYLSEDSEKKDFGEVELDSLEFNNTLQVLKYYGEDYKTKKGNVILITKELNKDWTLLWNYTSKANDIEWLNTHQLE